MGCHETGRRLVRLASSGPDEILGLCCRGFARLLLSDSIVTSPDGFDDDRVDDVAVAGGRVPEVGAGEALADRSAPGHGEPWRWDRHRAHNKRLPGPGVGASVTAATIPFDSTGRYRPGCRRRERRKR